MGELLQLLGADSERRYLVQADKALNLLARIPSGSVDCVWTDPPYFLSNDGFTCKSGRRDTVNKGDWDRSAGLSEDYQFHLKWLQECSRVLRQHGTLWVTGTYHAYVVVGMALLASGYKILNDIIWEKPSPPPNLSRRYFTHSSETLFWARPHASRHLFNYETMRRENGGKQMKSVWRFSPPSASEKRFGKHPTQKPVALIERCLRASTNIDDFVLDPFMGAGSTGVAALNLRRRFIGSDTDHNYVQLAERRLATAAVEPHEVRLI